MVNVKLTKVKKEIVKRLTHLNESELNWLLTVLNEVLPNHVSVRSDKLKTIISALPIFSDSQINWLETVIQRFELHHSYTRFKSTLISRKMLASFGDALLIHHSLSNEPLSKDRFEYMLERSAKLSGKTAQIARRGNPGHDLIIGKEKLSLKTQADANIKFDSIHISKYMELGHGQWTDDPNDLIGLRDQFLEHLKHYKRILTLRALRRPPEQWYYELVEIPKSLLLESKTGVFEMRSKSKQLPKPGYCTITDKKGN